MPTYEYRCEHCGYAFEKLQGMNDKPVKLCPQCGKGTKRLIGAGLGVIFKGTGTSSQGSRRQPVTGSTCCGADEPCAVPPCSDGSCKR